MSGKFIMHFDREGRPIELLDWAAKMEDPNYRYVAQETIGQYKVSTLWFGLNFNWGELPVGIFETMVFCIAGEPDEWDYYQVKSNSIGESASNHILICWNIRTFYIKVLESSVDNSHRPEDNRTHEFTSTNSIVTSHGGISPTATSHDGESEHSSTDIQGDDLRGVGSGQDSPLTDDRPRHHTARQRDLVRGYGRRMGESRKSSRVEETNDSDEVRQPQSDRGSVQRLQE
jgi:hypothetical protein